jgi:hypothetical protein
MNDSAFKWERVSGVPTADEELIADLKRVDLKNSGSNVTQKLYAEHGEFDCSTIIRRFGSWNKALATAGLLLSNEVNVSDERLFENLLILWQHYGRQPRRRELSSPPSSFSQTPYNRRFGSWTSALHAFIEYANDQGAEVPSQIDGSSSRRQTGRDPSLRLRWRVLQRDHFTCCACGASPAITPGVDLHVDHILPWSKGGETTIDNLQTLCSKCNLGKSNVG